MDDLIKSLPHKRGGVKGQVTMFKSFIDSIDETNVSHRIIIELEARLAKIETLGNQFESIQEQIECMQEEPVSQVQIRQEFYNAYYSAIAAAKEIIFNFNQCNTQIHNQNAIIRESTTSNHSNHVQNTHIKLPTIKLPQFDGSTTNWLEFADLFTALIHENEAIKETEKFYYLRSALVGEAAGVIQSIGTSAVNYNTAWDTLYERYNNSDVIIDTHVKALFELNNVQKESPHALRNLVDNAAKHLRCLKSLNEPVDQWSTLIIHIITSKLDHYSRREWERKRKELVGRPKFEDIAKHLQERWEILDKVYRDRNSNKQEHTTNKYRVSVANVSTNSHCLMGCKEVHALYFCDKFIKLSVSQRIDEVRRLNLCFNCFRDNHRTNNCKSTYTCRHCRRKHNTLVHIASDTDATKQIAHKQDKQYQYNNNNQQAPSVPSTSQSACMHTTAKLDTLLSTAVGKIKNSQGNFVECRFLLDSGSQSNYITNQFCKQLNLTPTPTNIQVIGINQAATNVCFVLNTTLYAANESFRVNLSLLVLDRITSKLPYKSFNKQMLAIPTNIELADKDFNISRPIDMLLGAEQFWTILLNNQASLGERLPILHETKFGWIVGGTIPNNQTNRKNHRVTCASNLGEIITKFWEIENVECTEPAWTEDQRRAEEHFILNTIRDHSGRFIVKLPLKENWKLDDSRHTAENRFLSLERRFRHNHQLKRMYSEFLDEYLQLGHMIEIKNESWTQHQAYYLPHHAVLRNQSLTTKIRVVFDASAKTDNGLSLNDIQHVGPTVQSELFDILLRFRAHKYILSADITKMYRQIRIDNTQQALQRILWRTNEREPLKCFELTTVTYGTASAPFLATRCLKQLAIENKDVFPTEASIIDRDIYVDDLLTGSDDIDTLITIKDNIVSILNQGCFELRKFLSNIPEFQHFDASGDPYVNINTAENKTLGIMWNVNTDTLRYELSNFEMPTKTTKRTIISKIAQLFDPLGLLSPIIVVGKLIIQSLWLSHVGWDDPISDVILQKWNLFFADLHNIVQLVHPRYTLCTEAQSIQVHGFADASERAFGACVYLRTVDKKKVIRIQLLTAKSRVAPLKQLSLPRLELSAALLLAQLIKKVKTALPILSNIDVYLWSDSTITLSWIASPSGRWKTFVANRVSQIQSITCQFTHHQWLHVKSEDNPADLISRGTTVKTIINLKLWWHGPTFLQQGKTIWLKGRQFNVNSDAMPEAKRITLITVEKRDFELVTRHSTLRTLLRVTTIMYKFINDIKTKINAKCGMGPSMQIKQLPILLVLVAISQRESFAEEIHHLQTNKPLKIHSRILALTPFLDKDNLLRVGGRLRHSELSENQKHPLLLDSKHHLTTLIVENEHKRLLHCGNQALLYSIRNQFWPIDGKNLCKRVIRRCITCFRVDPKFQTPLMGDLPKHRITPAPPFHITGMDFAGPILTKDKKGRGCKTIKSYICLFVCFASKAYHIEIVSDLSTENFLAAFKRFIARRGKPLHIYSDNATNFVGADAELKKLYEFLKSTEIQKSVNLYLNEQGITWHFIPPRAPHFGGLWESGIKNVKKHLKRIVGNIRVTYEELTTITTQIESVLNSRPLSPMSSNPNDFLPLTPAHFLIGRPLTSMPEGDHTKMPENRLNRYQLVTQTTQHFWNRWQQEYLCQLQQRVKWKSNITTSIQPGDLVLLREDNLPPLVWKVGRVENLIPGKDNIVRVVNVRLPNQSIMKRSINKICPFPKNTD